MMVCFTIRAENKPEIRANVLYEGESEKHVDDLSYKRYVIAIFLGGN